MADLIYLDEQGTGYGRRRCGKGFVYLDVQGSRISDRSTIDRLRRLAIPPAWAEVWIAPNESAHIQATGRDGRGRKQYIYHPLWEELRNTAKYDMMVPFAERLTAIRKTVDVHISRPALSREAVLAFVVRLLDETLLRIGNREYARLNDSYGLTTLCSDHVSVSGSVVELSFRGKSGKPHVKKVTDRRLARLARTYQELPGQTLLKYRAASGELEKIASEDVNQYLKQISGQDFTAKHFRTWGGSVAALRALRRLGLPSSEADARRKINQAMKETARCLGNTAAICRRYYVHPIIIELYGRGELFETMARAVPTVPRRSELSADEATLLSLLRAAVRKPMPAVVVSR